jgi:transcriptional regulator with AAA-type ATPase domain/transcriptional regulatory protein LevR
MNTIVTDQGVEAGEVAQALSIWRNDASADLNKLCSMGILHKRGKKPVFYYPAGLVQPENKGVTEDRVIFSTGESKGCDKRDFGNMKSKTAFRLIVGGNGSLKTQIQMAKAAVLYPPQGLHTLILGETGVGKSLFAEEMWRFATENKNSATESKPMPFIVFNCAEYADNPQLLMSQLFGHAKGAFTGASESKAGLVEKADGGIMFLDEIHRLPPVGQEIFFTLIDKGVYRRLGDTQDKKASLMIIGATTEEPSSILLQTFKRRIPVIIQLPTLMERPISEKISMIVQFLSQEANRLNASIWMSGQAFRVMVTQTCKTNIGELKNVLQLCCAKSYLSYLSSSGYDGQTQYGKTAQEPFLSIDVNDLPQRDYPVIADMDIPLDMLTQHIFTDGITAFPGMSAPFESFSNDYELSMDLYGFVERQLESYRLMHMTQGEIARLVTTDLERYYSGVIKAMHNSSESGDIILNNIISQKVWSTASHLLLLASKKLDRKYTNSIQAALALHLQQLKERDGGGHKSIGPDLKYIKSKYESEVRFIRSVLPDISTMLDIEIPEEEIGFLSMFLGQTIDENPPTRVGLIVVAHGRSTATSMADFANQLLVTDHVVGINAPINKSMANVYNELCAAVEECNLGKGVLLLVDMGSFSTMQDDIRSKTGIPCRIIPNVSSALVLEAAKVVITTDESLDEIAEKVSNRYRDYINTILPTSENRMDHYEAEIQVQEGRLKKRDVIITICSTGIGSAKKLGELIAEKVPAAKNMEIVPLSILDNVKDVARSLDNRLKLIVGNFNPEIGNVPFFSIETVLIGDGIGKINFLLQNPMESNQPVQGKPKTHDQAIRLIERQIRHFLPSLDTDLVMKHTVSIADRIGSEILDVSLSIDFKARIIFHVAFLLDRLAQNDVVPMPSWGKEKIGKRRAIFEKLRNIVNEEISAFGLSVPDSELAYMLINLIDDSVSPTVPARLENAQA